MKRTLILGVALLPAIASMADVNDGRFEKGMMWETSESYTESNGYRELTVHYFLDGETVINGRSCLELRSDCPEMPSLDRDPVTFLYQEDGKVWFHAGRNSDRWMLLYDFNVEAGETVEVARVPYNYSDSDEPEIFTYRLKCLSRETEDGLTYLTMQELHDGTPGNSVTDSDDLNIWIKGIGSESGLLWNYGNSLTGGWSNLKSASAGTDRLYPASSTGVENVMTTPPAETGRYHIDGTKATPLDRGVVIVTYSDGTVRKSVQ